MTPKDFRPIRLTSYQIAYWESSTHTLQICDRALHKTVTGIERDLALKQYRLGVFFDVEGDSYIYNPRNGSRSVGCESFEIPISKQSNFRCIRKRVIYQTEKGETLSSLLWCLTANMLLHNLKNADAIALTATGKHLQALNDLLQNALYIVSSWCSE